MTRKFIYLVLLATLIAGAMTVDTANKSIQWQQSPSSDTPLVETQLHETQLHDTLPPDTLPPVKVLQAKKPRRGDLNGDGKLDIIDINILCNIILQREEISTPEQFACADVVADNMIDIADVNTLITWVLYGEEIPDTPIDTIPSKAWLTVSPTRIISKMIINNSRNRTDFGNGRMLVWNVTPGDSLRLTVDHDNSIGVWMRSYVFYPSADSSTWTQANALAYGDGIKDIAGRKSYEITVPDGAAVMVCSGYWFEGGRVGDGASAATNPFTAYQLERWADTIDIAPRRQLRVLAIGNSFTSDELSYVPYVIQSIAPDVDLHMSILQRTNSGLQEWVDNPDSVSLGENSNQFYDWQPFPGRWSLPESSTLREQVAADQWDVVIVHHSSIEPYWNSVETSLRKLTKWLRESMGYSGRIGWMLSHAFSDSNVITSEAFPELTTSDEMWQLTQALADSVMRSGLVDMLIPSGTAVQNARHTRLNNFTLNYLCAGRWDNDETGDIHLQEGIGPFTAACAAAGVLTKQTPLKARVNITSNWRIPDADPHYFTPTTNPTLATIDSYLGGLGMDRKSQILGAWCAVQAIQQPFKLIEDIDDIPTEGWVVTPPARIIPKMIINNYRNRTDFNNGRMLVWNVTPGDHLRLSVDHDNTIGVWMRSYVFYPSADASTWTQANALAYGDGIKDIAGSRSYDITVPDGAAVMVCSGYWFEGGRIGDGASAATNPFTAYQLECWGDTFDIAPRRPLRVLAVGNSFTSDELSYVPYVVQSIAPDVDLHLRILQRSNSRLQDWVNNPDLLSLGENDNKVYDWQPFPGRWSLPTAGSLRQQIEAEQWDVVIVHHSSIEPYWNSVETSLRKLTKWLRESMGYSGRIGWMLSHAFSDSNMVYGSAFPELSTSDQMWQLTQTLAKSVMQSGLVDMLIPSGTAIQNARRTKLDDFTYNQLCSGRWENGETGDIHLQEGIGPFVAACAAAGALTNQSPLEAQVDISSTWRIPDADPHYSSPSSNPTLEAIENLLGGLGMDTESQTLGAWCADQAIQRPFELIKDQRPHPDTSLTKDWVIMPPVRIIPKKIINSYRNLEEFGNGRALVWNVIPGDTLRLTVDHDNSLDVWMRSYAFYPSTDPAKWTQANALAYGDGIKDIDGRKTYVITVPRRAAVMVCSGYWFEDGRIGDGASASRHPFTAYQLEHRVDTTGMAPRRQLRVLAVGNSFTCDELSYVPYVIQSIAPDVDLHLRLFKRPTGQISQWAENTDSMSLGEYPNLFYDWQPFPGRWSLPEVGSLRQQIEADQWDVITFQQVSSKPYWNTVEEPLRRITTWLRDTMNYHGRIGWLLNHVYSDSNVIYSEAFPELTTGDQMWQLTQALAKSVMQSGLVDLLIPSGTAVQNARHTLLNDFTFNQLCAGQWDNGEKGDIHLQEGIGPFVAACAAAGALIDQSPLDARVNLSSTWIIPGAHPSYESLVTNPTLDIIEEHLGGLGMDPESQELGAWCADQALQHPFELIDSTSTGPGGNYPNSLTAPLMKVKYDGQDLLIASNNGQGIEMCYTFRKCMSNNLFTFANVGYRPVKRRSSSTSGIASGTDITWLNTATSDNIGPFSVKGYDDFIGGNHTWREIDSQGNLGAYTDICTATCDSVSIHLDDELMSVGSTRSGQCVTIDVWNTIMDPRIAPANGATVLSSPLIAEHAIYTIQKNSITVSMDHHYYKDITVNRYYGMQSMFRNEDFILTPKGAYLTWTPSYATNSFKKLQYPNFHRFVEYNSTDGFIQSSHLLPVGLGNHDCISNNTYIFVRNGTKDYHVAMDNYGIPAGGSTQWKGIYSWAQPLVNDSIVLAYESVMDDNDVIYIDAKTAGTSTLTLPAGWSDFRVVSSDNGITLNHANGNQIVVIASTAASAIIERVVPN